MCLCWPNSLWLSPSSSGILILLASLGDEKEKGERWFAALWTARRVFEQYSKQNFKQSVRHRHCAKLTIWQMPAPSAKISFPSRSSLLFCACRLPSRAHSTLACFCCCAKLILLSLCKLIECYSNRSPVAPRKAQRDRQLWKVTQRHNSSLPFFERTSCFRCSLKNTRVCKQLTFNE